MMASGLASSVVGHHRTFLLAIERLDRGVDVENPGGKLKIQAKIKATEG